MKEQLQHCFNCGKELGVYVRYHGDEPECCGDQACQRELRDQMNMERERRQYEAEQDNYGRYS